MWQPQDFYSEYSLRIPAILSGPESIRSLYDFPSSRIAVIHGKSFTDKELFRSAFPKRELAFFERAWRGEPDLHGLSETLHELEEFSPDTILAVGGGSVIDGGKLCRLFYEFPSFSPGTSRLDGEQFTTHFIAVPTTIGSGAEVSSAAVYLDRAEHRKDMVVLHELQPDAVVYDERYVAKASERILAASMLDALSHILEGYVSNRNNQLMDVLAEKGLAILVEETARMIDDGDASLDYRRLQYAGMIGGLVQNHCIVGAAHAVAHQLAEYGYPHGEAVGLLLPTVIPLNAGDKATAAKYNKITQAAGLESVSELTGMIRKLLDYSGISTREPELRSLLAGSMQKEEFRNNVKKDKGGKGNPIPITDEYLCMLSGSF